VDKFPGDLTDEVARLRAEVAELKALLKTRPALTTASQGWRMTDMTIPSVGAGEIHIGSNDGEFYVRTADETKRLNQLNVPVTTPTYPASFSSPATVSGTVLPEHYNLLRADVVAQTFNILREVINRLATVGVWPEP
jgi:hypothetical protein